MFKAAAQGDHRSISNFIEHATTAYITEQDRILVLIVDIEHRKDAYK